MVCYRNYVEKQTDKQKTKSTFLDMENEDIYENYIYIHRFEEGENGLPVKKSLTYGPNSNGIQALRFDIVKPETRRFFLYQIEKSEDKLYLKTFPNSKSENLYFHVSDNLLDTKDTNPEFLSTKKTNPISITKVDDEIPIKHKFQDLEVYFEKSKFPIIAKENNDEK